MDLKRLETIVKDNAKCFEYELFLLRRKNLKISTENGNFEKITTAEDYGLGLRLLRDGKMGFSYTSDLSPEAVKKLVKDLVEITSLLPPDGGNRFFDRKEEPLAPSPYDERGLSLPVEEKIDRVISFERSVISSHPNIVGTRETTFSEVEYGVSFLNSFGVEYSYRGTAYSIVSSALAESPKGDRNITWGYRASRYLENLDLEGLKKELVLKAVDTLDPSPIESRSLRVLFHPGAFASLLEVFSELFSGENLVKGKTPLAGKEGETLAAPMVSLIDDGTLEGGFATHPYDDEGVPQRKTPLLDGGVLKGFYHSLWSATKAGAEPTGNGFRSSFTSPPAAGISNLYLAPVEGSFEEFLKADGEILVVYDLMGLHTADPISGDFSLGVSGALYRNGKKVAAVRGATVAGNFLQILKGIEAVGKDLTFYGNVGSPSVVVKNITIGGK